MSASRAEVPCRSDGVTCNAHQNARPLRIPAGHWVSHVAVLVEDLLGKGIGFRSLQDSAIHTTTASGELMFNIFSRLTRFQKRTIQEHNYGGLAAVQTRGRIGGRRAVCGGERGVVIAERQRKVRSLATDGNFGTLGSSRPAFHRDLALGLCAAYRLIPSMNLTASVFAVLALCACTCATALAADYAWPIVRIVDGDTVAVDASTDLPPELARLNVRLRGVDTPEKGGRAKCPFERQAGQAATAFTETAIAKALHILVRDPEWGKWGGRVVADVILDGRSLSAVLIATGHCRPYSGGRRGSWCQ